MNIKNCRWFTTPLGTVGVVAVENEFDTKYYISAVSGKDEIVDRQYIADWGAAFPKLAGDILFGT